jgi:hypothetical protein
MILVIPRFARNDSKFLFMPSVPFSELPSDARVWIFASDRPLGRDEAAMLLEEVDAFLEGWKAHGAPLRGARDWRDDRFLAIGIDPTAEQASGCSIDGLFRRLREMEEPLATGLVGGGRVFYRRRNGQVNVAQRNELRALATSGEIGEDTRVFDTSITDAASWRERFERPAKETWVASLLGASAGAR